MYQFVERDQGGAVLAKLESRSATLGIIGLGYVGLPLAAAAARAGFNVVGFDVDLSKIEKLAKRQSYIDAVSDDAIGEFSNSGKFVATSEFSQLANCDAIAICVPTPLTKHRDPDLSFVEATARIIAQHLRKGQLVVLESTTYPGTTEEVVKPILEGAGLKSGRDFYIGYSPEREDPGNAGFETATIPKVVAGDGLIATKLVGALYMGIVQKVVPVSSIKVAEVVKLTENIFRCVNIALVNELKIVYAKMGIDIWEVIEAAKTKPFGYMPFYPGPGLGGHCIPIDPFYLTWKAREFDCNTRFIELAGEINVSMPHYVIERLIEALDNRFGIPLSQAAILIVGVAYKKNVSDIRESPALKLIELLTTRVADLAYHDPFVVRIPKTRKHPLLAGKDHIRLNQDSLAAYDAVIIATDHDGVDYELLGNYARLIVDTRNAMQSRGVVCNRVVKA